MGTDSENRPLKSGLLIVALTWFVFTFYELVKCGLFNGTYPFWILLTDTAALIGLAFRTVGAFIAVIAVLFYIVRRNLSKPEALMSIRWVLLAEAVYVLSFLPSGIWGFTSINRLTAPNFNPSFLIETGIPCLVQSILPTILLVKLFFKLNPDKPAKEAIKWSLLVGTAYILVFWLNNMTNWVAALLDKGLAYITDNPLNLLSFALTTLGLLALTLYAAYFTKKSSAAKSLAELNPKPIGAVITALGLYFAIIYMLWIFFGSVGGWSGWYAWFLGHNVDLWVLSLPMVGVPLLFSQQRKE